MDLNLLAGILHGAIGAGSLVWVHKKYNPDNAIPLPFKVQDDWLLVKLILAFTFITMLFHMVLYFLKQYRQKLLAGENNYIRWIEYGITSSLMLAVISFLIGVQIVPFVTIIIANLIMILLGHMVECYLRDSKDGKVLAASIAAWTCFIVVWSLELRFFFAQKVPTFVTVVTLLMLVLFSLFGAVQLYHILSKKSYTDIDRLYILLSFISKTTLTLLVLGGIMGRNLPGLEEQVP